MLHFVRLDNYLPWTGAKPRFHDKRPSTTSLRKPVARSNIRRRSTSVKERSSIRFSTCGVSSSSHAHHSGNVTRRVYHARRRSRLFLTRSQLDRASVHCPSTAQTPPNFIRLTSTHGHQRKSLSLLQTAALEALRAGCPKLSRPIFKSFTCGTTSRTRSHKPMCTGPVTQATPADFGCLTPRTWVYPGYESCAPGVRVGHQPPAPREPTSFSHGPQWPADSCDKAA
jgi:hypothetical protein